MMRFDEYYDVVIVGTGAAGLYCALNFPKRYKVLLLTKQKADECDSFLAQGGVLAYSLPDACPHATTAHRRFVYTEPTDGGIMLEHGDTPRKYTVYAIETDGRMIVGDVTV